MTPRHARASRAGCQEREKNAKLEAQILTIDQQRVTALIDSAKHEATVAQLQAQVVDKTKQMESWVRRFHKLNHERVSYDVCDDNGSII